MLYLYPKICLSLISSSVSPFLSIPHHNSTQICTCVLTQSNLAIYFQITNTSDLFRWDVHVQSTVYMFFHTQFANLNHKPLHITYHMRAHQILNNVAQLQHPKNTVCFDLSLKNVFSNQKYSQSIVNRTKFGNNNFIIIAYGWIRFV